MTATTPRRRHVLGALSAAPSLFLLTGCTTLSTAPRPSTPHTWSGRFSLYIESEKPEQLSAIFELTGDAARGTLSLTTPLGTTLAELQWDARGAFLVSGETRHESGSLESLLVDAVGTRLPMKALFQWLDGNPMEAMGWVVDLSRRTEGRITARRLTPSPQATLRLILTQ